MTQILRNSSGMSLGAGMGAVAARPLAVGWIHYWNLLPLKHELSRQAAGELDLQKGTPTQVNKLLSEGKVALAPCSSVCLLRNPTHDVALPLGVAASGSVGSVYIGFQREHATLLEHIRQRQQEVRVLFKEAFARQGQDTRKIAAFVWGASSMQPQSPELPPALSVTPASATSAALGRILYRLWFGELAFNLLAAEGGPAALAGMSERKPLELLIGDEALNRKSSFWQVIDLSEAWHQLTDLPFVFSVWQTARRPLTSAWRQRLIEAGELAQARMKIEPSVYFPDMPAVDAKGNAIDLAAYWKQIHYRLGPAHFRGLALYLSFVRCMLTGLTDDSALGKIMRWEAMADTPQLGCE